MNNNNDFLCDRTRYLIYLAPEKSFENKLTSRIDKLISKGHVKNSNTLELHTTILGFYSEFSKLGFDSVNSLESEIVSIFDTLNTKIKEPIMIKALNKYNTHHVLELESNEVKRIHYDTLNAFKSLMVLKGSILPKDDPIYFAKRYPYVADNYAPHISLFSSMSDTISNKYFKDLLNTCFYFNRIVLSKKEQDTWNIMLQSSI